MIGAMVIVSILLSVVIGIPTYLVLRRIWKIRLPECLATGVGTALIFDFSLLLVTMLVFQDGIYSAGDSGGATYIDGTLTRHGWWGVIIELFFHMILGASIGLFFWIIAIWQGPRSWSKKASPFRARA